MKDLLKLDNGREFMSFVQSRRSGMMRSHNIEQYMQNSNMTQGNELSHSNKIRRSQINLAPQPHSPIYERKDFKEYRMSNDFEKSKNDENNLKPISSSTHDRKSGQTNNTAV